MTALLEDMRLAVRVLLGRWPRPGGPAGY